MPWDRCLSVCVCDVDVLWLNGWMDQDATWYGGRPRRRPHCVRWGPAPPSKKEVRVGHSSPQFSAHVYCVQTAGWIETEVGLGPGDILLDGDPAPPWKGAQQPPFWAHFAVARSPISATAEMGDSLYFVLHQTHWQNSDEIMLNRQYIKKSRFSATVSLRRGNDAGYRETVAITER